MNLSERLRQIIEAVTSPTRRFVALEEQTGVKAETWRTWWNRGGKASADLIQAAGQTWPEYAFWLVTGTDDFYNGHTSPPTSVTEKSSFRERDAAKAFFQKKIEYARWQQNGASDAYINGNLLHREEILQRFTSDISDLLSLRIAQEDALNSIEEKGAMRRIDSPY